ncbi:hypothetical protein D8I24_5835 [Cupriavidus necator H850]|nr:hypothetical protein D8I24_5835 [Cupriavidus necator H850]
MEAADPLYADALVDAAAREMSTNAVISGKNAQFFRIMS